MSGNRDKAKYVKKSGLNIMQPKLQLPLSIDCIQTVTSPPAQNALPFPQKQNSIQLRTMRSVRDIQAIRDNDYHISLQELIEEIAKQSELRGEKQQAKIKSKLCSKSEGVVRSEESQIYRIQEVTFTNTASLAPHEFNTNHSLEIGTE